MTALEFDLPPGLAAAHPRPNREQTRLLVARPSGIEHAVFAELDAFLRPGDLLVVNTSATLAAALDGRRADGRALTVHFATALDDGRWVVELRPAVHATGPLTDVAAGERVRLPDGVTLTVLEPAAVAPGATRLWRAEVGVEGGVEPYLARHGRPIRYGYLDRPVPLADYQTVFARHPGSAEMPSAGRPFTAELVTGLVAAGVALAPITLHTGVSSQEAGEPPMPERFTVPAATARMVNSARAGGGRVVAVGTTVTRALESAADRTGRVRPKAGWTELVLGPTRRARVVTGLITGWHAPGASHLQLLQAVAGTPLVAAAYDAALRERYLWHEFGDSCLLLP